jgi:YQGE family putative transporter
MLLLVKKRLETEYSHFIHLGDDARKLLLSFSFYELVLPLIFGFINAFLFRQNQSFISVVQYNVGLFISIPLFFYLNGHLLRFFKLKRLYQVGLLGQGLVLNLLFFIPTSSWIGLVSFGLIQGVFVGLYWANRNFMSLEITNDSNRQYFVGLEQIFAIGSELLAPLIIGGVITIGTSLAFVSVQGAYKILGGISFVLLILAAKMLGDVRVTTPKIKKLFLTNPSKQWWFARLAEATYGSFHGVNMFLPTLLVFQLIGEEGVLGVMQSVAALFTVVVIYYLSRKLKPSMRVLATAIAIGLLLLLSIFLSISFVSLAAVLFITIVPAINKVRWQTWNPTVMSAIDAQDNGNQAKNYAYVVDREIWLNIGRLVGVFIFVLTLQLVSETAAIRFSPLAIAIVQLGFVFAMHMVVKLHPKNKKMNGEDTVIETTAEAV